MTEGPAAALARLNALPEAEAEAALARCCGTAAWARAVAGARPYASEAALFAAAGREWRAAGEAGWREAFAHHPRIGEAALAAKFGATAAWAGGEQGAAAGAPAAVLRALAERNAAYEERFGYIFIVCATGKSAEEMLALLEARLSNPPAEELRVAAEEQWKITALRLGRLLEEGP